MSDHRSPPPAAEACLERPRPSSQKGGTLIAENVTDLETHRRRLCDPDGYRPAECARCRSGRLHMHDRRSRTLVGDPETSTVTVAIFRCAGCGATWRILPRFVARHLWRSWRVVEGVTVGKSSPSSRLQVSERTERRWWQRLRSSARSLAQWLASSGKPLLEGIVHAAGIDAAREGLITVYATVIRPAPGHVMASLAALIHRLGPGIRLM